MTPTAHLTRRTLLKGGGVAAATLALGPLSAQAAAAVAAAAGDGVFGFGVASGDPTATEVLLWTRVTPIPTAMPGSGLGGPTTVDWEVSADPDFRSLLRRGKLRSDPRSDHTIKVVVSDLGGGRQRLVWPDQSVLARRRCGSVRHRTAATAGPRPRART